MSEETTNTPQVNTEEISAATTSEKSTEPVDTSEDNTAASSSVQQEEVTEPSTVETQPSQEETVIEPTTDVNKASELLQEKGFDYDKLQQEYNQYGDITAETREQLAAKGITSEILDNYIEGQKAIVAQQMSEIADSVGGKEQFDTIVNWAKENLTEDEKKQIDEIHEPTAIKYVLAGLKARMEASDGVIPQQLQGEGGKAPSNLFEDMSEVRAAISDPRYEVSESYRAQVAQKITASREAGKIDL